MTTIHTLTSAALREAANLQEQIEALGARLLALFGGEESNSEATKSPKGRRIMSPAARARIAEAQRRRWAARGRAAGGNSTTKGPKKTARATTAGRKRPSLSPEARARIGAAQKARWEKARGGAANSTSKVAAGSKRKSGGLTPEGRARLAAAMKARWAAKKKAA